MSTTIARWGNSFGIRLPKAALEQADMAEGDRVDVVSQNGQLVIVKAKKKSLDELVSKMTPENSHAETLITRVGNEVW